MRDAVPTLKALKVGGVSIDLEWLLNAPYDDIGEAAAKIPPAIGYLGYHKSLCTERLILAEQNWKKVEAQQYFVLRGGGFESSGLAGKMTEDALKHAVALQPPVEEAAAEYAHQKQQVDWFGATIEAFQAKLELVRSSEATKRMEHEPDKNRRAIV